MSLDIARYDQQFMVTSTPNSQAIVVVEDPLVQRFVCSVLESVGQAAVECDARNAIDLVSSGNVKLLITNTPQLFERFAHQLLLVYMAQCPDPDLASPFRECRILQKPFRARQLLQAVGEIAAPL